MNPIVSTMTEPTARRLRRGRLAHAQIRPNSIWPTSTWPQANPESEILTMPRPRETVSAISLRRAAWTPGDEVQMDALVAACALVAHADGWVTPDERRKLVERIGGLDAAHAFGPQDVLLAFETRIAHFEQDLDGAEADAEAAIAKLRSRPEAARLLARAACDVAAADGGFDGEERQSILRICELLELDPAEFDLTTPVRRPV